MTSFFLVILILSLLLLAYYRIPLLISVAILAGLTFVFTECWNCQKMCVNW